MSEAIYEVTARNFSESSENKIHSDEIAKKYGFKGALVPGVAVYGHLVYPLVDQLGDGWLASSHDSLRLHKPAYHNDQLRLTTTIDGQARTVNCHNAEGTLLATLTSGHTPPPEPDEFLARLSDNYKNPERVVIGWDTVTPGENFAPWEVSFTAELNQKYTTEVADTSPLYADYVHPHLLLSLANTALTNEYVMPTWIHVGSETRHRAALKVGDTISIKSVVDDKWRNKGHEFIRIWTSYWRADVLTTDIVHTAIFKVAD